MRWAKLIRNTVQAAVEDDLLNWSAALAFYFLFALFPAILIVAALLSTFDLQGLTQSLVAALGRHLPQQVATMVVGELDNLLRHHVPGLISTGIVVLLYSASQGFTALMAALNAAYEVPETRSFGRRTLLAWGLTFSAGAAMALALALVVLGERVLPILVGPAYLNVSGALAPLWPVIRWAVTVAFLALAVRLLYHYAPNARPSASGGFAAVGFALALWIVASALFAAYVDRFSYYAAVYGSLGGVIALMLWFYILALTLLMGAEFHNEWLKQRGEHREAPPAHSYPKAA